MLNFLTSVPAVEGSRFFFDWEISLMEWLQATLSDGAISFISQFSMFGEELLMIVIMGFFYWCYDKGIGKFIGLNMLMGNVFNPMLKNIFCRLRPYFCSDGIDLKRLIDTGADKYDVAAQGYSFPSGHSEGSAAVYGSIGLALKKKWAVILAFLLPLLVGISRVVVGAHFPTDVLVGWSLGVLVIFFVPWLKHKVKKRWLFYLILGLLAFPGWFYCKSNDYYTTFGMLIGYFAAESFEEKFVRFESTRSPVRSILRVAGGGAVYFALNTALKLPFPAAVLEANDLTAHLIRAGRYAIVLFVVLAVYPMLFKLTAKIGAKKEPDTAA